MDIIKWFLQLNASELTNLTNLTQNNLSNNSIFFAYVVICLFIKRPVFLLAFFISAMLFELQFFDVLKEWELYLLTFCLYSYVFTVCCDTLKSKVGCSGLISLAFLLAVDAGMYGKYGYYGASETILYDNIELISLYAHIIFISTLVNVAKIRDSLRDFTSFIGRVSFNCHTMRYFCYNIKNKPNKDI